MRNRRRVSLAIAQKLFKYRYEILLFLIFFFALAFRLYFVFQTPYFSDDTAYFTLRQIDHVRETGLPLLHDELSYGGKDTIYLPLYSYIMAAFSFIPYGLKVVPAIFISCLVFIVYLIALKFTNDKFTSLVAALMSSFIPVVISSTLNNLSIFSLVIPLVALMFYSFVNIRSKPYLYLFIVLSFVVPLLHPVAVFVALSLIIFYVLVLAENIELNRLSKEALVFSVFLTLLIEFLFFKSAFLFLGLRFMWQNTPTDILANYFKDLNLIGVIFELGVIPFVLGILGFTIGFFRDKNIGLFLSLSGAFSALILLSLKLVNFSVGLMFLGVILVIASPIAIFKFFKYLKITKFSRFDTWFKVLLVLIVLGTLVIPSFYDVQVTVNNTLSRDEFLILDSIRSDTEPDATILSLFSEGHYITALGERKNVMDSDFLSAPFVNTRYSDVSEIYTSVSEVKALQLLEKYDVDYIYFSPRAKEFYNVQNLTYTEDGKCFVEYRKAGEVYLYKVRC
ncbi:MAG: hypothetical protein ABIH63_00910 [archaeon]